MSLSSPFILLAFVAAIVITLTRGAGMAFAVVYLPSLILLNGLRNVELPGVPDVTIQTAAIYGILLASLPRIGERMNIRFNFMDWIVIAIWLSSIITAISTEKLYTGVSTTGSLFLTYVAPYFLARTAFHSMELRRTILWVLIGCALIIGLFALIEFRLWPYYYQRLLISLRLPQQIAEEGVGGRFGFFRAKVSFSHPIDLGCAALVIMAMVGMFSTVTSVSLRSKTVWAAMGAMALAVVASISFTCFLGMAAALGVYFLLTFVPWLRTRLHWVVLGMFVVGLMFHSYMMTTSSVSSWDQSPLERSFRVRALIVQNTMGVLREAGLFGFGGTLRRSDIDLDSVDNSYMLLGITRGWVGLGLWLLIPVCVAARVSRAMAVCKNSAQQWPMVVAFSAIMGTMVAMYTVWQGAIYGTLWHLLIAFTMTASEICLGRAAMPAVPMVRFRVDPSAMAGQASVTRTTAV
jgi:hypothetical protein